MLDSTPGQSPTPLRLPFRNVHSGPNEDAGPAGQFRLQNCTRTRLVLESRCGRIEYLFQTTQNPGQNQSASKTVPELATHWHLGVPSPNCMLRLQFWDGACYHRRYWDGTFSPAIFTARCAMAPSHLQYFTARFAMAPSHLENGFTGRFAIAPSHLEKSFTGKVAMASSHLEFFFLQIWHSTFSPANFSPAELAWHLPGLPNAPKKQK